MAASMGRATSLSRSFDEILARHADPEALHAAPERAEVVVRARSALVESRGS